MGKVTRTDDLTSHPSTITGVHVHPAVDHIVMTTSRDGTFHFTDDDKLIANMKIHKSKILSSCLSRTKGYFSSYNKLFSYDIQSNMMYPLSFHFVQPSKLDIYSKESYLTLIGDKAIHVVDSHQKQLIFSIKTHKKATGFQFFNDNELLYASNDTVYRYDIRSQSCIATYKDSNFQSKQLAVNGNGINGYLATGSSNGNVHLYRFKDDKLDLIKEFGNTTTSINGIHFSDSYLFFHSDVKKDSAKVVDLTTLQVFDHWPTQLTPLGYIQYSAFSDSKMIIGNSKGKVQSYQIN